MGIKKFKDFILEKEDLSREEKEQAIAEFLNSQDDGSSFDPDILKDWSDEKIDSTYKHCYSVQEELDGSAGGASTTATVGSGTAVGSGDSGSFTSAMGVSVSGGDSGSAFATNSNVSGMGEIKSAQPSSTPGDVKGSTKGSGDIGSNGGAYTKQYPAPPRKKKKTKKASKRSKTASDIDKLYVTKYSQTDKGDGKVIQNWKTYKESLTEGYMSKGNKVKVTHKDDEDFGKEGIITKGFGQDGDFVIVKINNKEVSKNVSSLLDLDTK